MSSRCRRDLPFDTSPLDPMGSNRFPQVVEEEEESLLSLEPNPWASSPPSISGLLTLPPGDLRALQASQEAPREGEELEIILPYWAARLDPPGRYKVTYGGRGGGKSWSIARKLLLRSLEKKLLILCARELQVSIKDSVHKLLCDQAEEMGVQRFFRITKTELTVPGMGSEFIFKGLRHNVSEIKSLEGVDVCWVEEAQAVSNESWKLLIPTIRREASEIWISFNPDLEEDPTYQRFVKKPPPGTILIRVGWEDNPWLSGALQAEKDYLYSIDPEAADHVWGGLCRSYSSAQVLKGKWAVDRFVPVPSWDGPYYGIDWGFSTDPLAMVECWVDRETNELLISREAWGLGIEIDEVSALWRHTFNRNPSWPIRSDNSRPETISHVRKMSEGLPKLMAADKWPGSVEDGITFLRNFRRIRIHEGCPHTIQEARDWRYKVDPLTRDVLPILVDANNHCWDAARYALQPLIRKRTAVYAGAVNRSA